MDNFLLLWIYWIEYFHPPLTKGCAQLKLTLHYIMYTLRISFPCSSLFIILLFSSAPFEDYWTWDIFLLVHIWVCFGLWFIFSQNAFWVSGGLKIEIPVDQTIHKISATCSAREKCRLGGFCNFSNVNPNLCSFIYLI